MSRATNFILSSHKCRTTKKVLVFNRQGDGAKNKDGSLFPDCKKCEYSFYIRLNLGTRCRLIDRDLYVQPRFKLEHRELNDHLYEEHGVRTSSQLAYIVASDGLRKHEKMQNYIHYYDLKLEKSEIGDNSSGIFKNGRIELHYEMTHTIEERRSCTLSSVAQPDKSVDRMRRLLEMDYLTDLEIITKDGTIKGHKAVLAMASPVFKAMFESDRKQERESQLKLDPVNTQVAKNFLHYIYTDELNLKVEDEHEMAMELLILADYYQIESLRVLCENRLLDKLSTETAVDVLSLSLTYGAEKLRKNALKFIHINRKIFAAQDDLVELMGSLNLGLRKGLLEILADLPVSNDK